MNNHAKAAVVLVGIGLLALIGWHFMLPIFNDWSQKNTSDAKMSKGKITVAYDNWIGYFPLCSPEMKKQMRASGWNWQCEDDKADYPGRMQRLKNRDIQFAVATVDSYVLNGAPKGFPGVVSIVIDESKGADAIIARKDKTANLNAVKGRADLRIAYTPGSPSHHLLKVAAIHFGVPELLPPQGPRRIETNGSEEALKKLLSGEADIAVLWEPDVSRALAKGNFVKLLGTENTEQLIVDILLVGREFVDKNPDVVKLALSTYFQVLKFYRDNPDILTREIIAETKLPPDAVKSMLSGVAWVNLTDNAQQWFGVSYQGRSADEGLFSTIESTVRILRSSGDFQSNPIPDSDPNRLIRSEYVRELYIKGSNTGFTVPGHAGSPPVNSLEARFTPLDGSGWKGLREVGTLKIQPITFQSGTADLSLDGKTEIDAAVEALRHYPKFRVLIKGHTGMSGDPDVNQKLSQERAESVMRYLTVTFSIDPNRLKAVGIGSDEPLSRTSGESDRAYNYRLPRVEIYLVSEVY